MKAILLQAPHEMKMVDIPMPEPRPGEARVRVLATGICGSELHAWEGLHEGRKPPVITGHEVCGVVDALGPGAAGPSVGIKVVAMPQQGCGQCQHCKSGHTNLCAQRLMLGFTAWPGSYAEYFTIPSDLLIPIRQDLDPEIGALMEPLAVAFHAVGRVASVQNRTVGVFGSGAIGLCCLLAALARGASAVVAVDREQFNLELARDLGASSCFNSRNTGMADFMLEVTAGKGLDVAIMAAGAPTLLDPMLHSMAIGASIVLVAHYVDQPPFDLELLKSREMVLTGSQTYIREDFEAAVALAHEIPEKLRRLITHRFTLNQAPEAFRQATEARKDMVRVIFSPFQSN